MRRWLNKQKWEEFGGRRNGKEYENMSEMNSVMAKEAMRWRNMIIGKKKVDG